jgi:hypothetical protein
MIGVCLGIWFLVLEFLAKAMGGRVAEDTAMISFLCPSCESTLNAPLRKRGAVSACPRCHTKVRVPTEFEEEIDVDLPRPHSRLAGGLRFLSWAGCLAVVGWTGWWYYQHHQSLLEANLLAAACVPMLGAYIAARAINGLCGNN